MFCLFTSLRSYGRQSIFFKDSIGMENQIPISIFSRMHKISINDLSKGRLVYSGDSPQIIQLEKVLLLSSLTIENLDGVTLKGMAKLLDTAILKKGVLSLVKETKQKKYGLIFLKNAIYSGYNHKNYIRGPIKTVLRPSFNFPFGNKNLLYPLNISSNTQNIELTVVHHFKQNNLANNSIYSSPNALKRIGIKQLDLKSFWDLFSTSPNSVYISLETLLPFYQKKGISQPGLAGWNPLNKNWEIISSSLVPPFEATLTNKKELGQRKRIVTEGFPANKYTRLALCDCITPKKKYKSYGNHIITVNGDGINEIPLFKNYTTLRNGYFLLYDRYGNLIFQILWNSILKGNDPFREHIKLSGTYFYLLHLKNPKQIEQGYIYILKK
jgi:hypothetical protein